MDERWVFPGKRLRSRPRAKVSSSRATNRLSPKRLLTSTTGAKNFIDLYYDSVNNLSKLESFYIDSNAKYSAASLKADISINGKVVEGGPAGYEKMLQHQANGKNKIIHEVESYNPVVVNPDFMLARPDNLKVGADAPVFRNNPPVSMNVLVSGEVRYGAGRDAERANFTENFILVPNWDAWARNPPRNMKKFLIYSQNFQSL